jgi:2,4-dienoyl-CoA reductase-like NADH-dependent reductase (Old Yellow Enzyme family)
MPASGVQLTRVYEPIRVGPVEIGNRIARTAHGTAFSTPRGLFGGDDLIAYHVARARGGVGLTILDAEAVHPSSTAMSVSDDRTVERYEELVAAVAPHGMRLFQQLFHGGHRSPAVGGRPPWAVTTMASPHGTVGTPMSAGQIQEIVGAFGTAARRCRDGGLDGVEVHAAHAYLVAQFLSPVLNTRTDDYGGSLENRMRFLVEILRAIRGEVGDGIAVGVRLGASQLPGSLTEDMVGDVIRRLQQDGLIDFISTSLGDVYRRVTVVGPMDEPVGYELASARQLTAVASVPTIVTGRFGTLEQAEQVLTEGVADMVSMVRALIADPDIVRKTREGRADEIRPCIACNQACYGGVSTGGRMGCVVNPAVGFERTLSEDLIIPAASPRTVLVVGGGPAGLEAARIAALCGHDVTLAEASSRLGGAVNAARRSPRFALLGDIVDWLEGAVDRAGVRVELDAFVSAGDVARYGADTVIVATGSTPRLDGLQPAYPVEPARGADQAHVRSSNALLTGGLPPGAGTALVLDTVGHFEAITVAEFLVGEGVAVTYVTSLPSFGGVPVLSSQRDVPALEFLYRGDFTLLTRHHLVDIRPSSCLVRPLQASRTQEVPADVVVLVTPNEPRRGLYDELAAAADADLHLIGDAAAPRDLKFAIDEGHRTARALAAGRFAA